MLAISKTLSVGAERGRAIRSIKIIVKNSCDHSIDDLLDEFAQKLYC